MFFYPFFQIVRLTAVERVVFTAQHIDKAHIIEE